MFRGENEILSTAHCLKDIVGQTA